MKPEITVFDETKTVDEVLTCNTPAGAFSRCMKIKEGTALNILEKNTSTAHWQLGWSGTAICDWSSMGVSRTEDPCRPANRHLRGNYSIRKLLIRRTCYRLDSCLRKYFLGCRLI